jgi:RNA-binding protein YlmH
VKKVVGEGNIKYYEYGGFINAENKRMIICPDFYDINNEDFEVVTVKVEYNDHFGKLMHKDILGALMNLGIDRSCVGDIDDKELCFACTKQSYQYIKDNLKQIKKSKIKLKEIVEEIEIKREYSQKTFIVSSFRLDKLVSVLYGVPRVKTKSYIQSGYVKVNHKVVEEVSFLCHNNDMISLRKYGRVKIVDENRLTRQENHVISGYFYK